MEPMELSGVNRVARTSNWQKLRWFEKEMDRVALETAILVQYANELVALDLLLCKL